MCVYYCIYTNTRNSISKRILNYLDRVLVRDSELVHHPLGLAHEPSARARRTHIEQPSADPVNRIALKQNQKKKNRG